MNRPVYHISAQTLRYAVALLSCALLLTACETTPEVVPVADPELAWQEQQSRLADLHQWRAVGKIAIRSQEDSWNAGLQWEQDRDSYRIRLSGPLGQGLMELTGEPGRVEMRTSDKQVYRAAAPDDLLLEHTGWRVPVAGLRYWILGRPAPEDAIGSLALDPAGRLAQLYQSGWHIQYQRYKEFDGIPLPTKMTLENPKVQAKLIVRSWDLKPGET